jgi:tetratricopeptide (TPR) repeat protein
VPQTADAKSPQRIDALASAWTRRGIALLSRAKPQSLAVALESFDRAIALRQRLDLEADVGFRYGFTAGWLNRADALTRLAGPERLYEAVQAYDIALTELDKLPRGQDPRFELRRGIAWMNRGFTLAAMTRPVRRDEALSSFQNAVSVLHGSPFTNTPEHRRALAASLVNIVRIQPVDDSRTDVLLHEALLVVSDLELSDIPAAEIALQARIALCRSLARGSIDQETDVTISDLVDDGLARVRHWQDQGITLSRKLVADLFAFGATFYRIHQPQFLGEFLRENMNVMSPPPRPLAAAICNIARQALQLAVGNLVSSGVAAFSSTTGEVIEDLRDLRRTEKQLEEFHRAVAS